jgi:hypothetical protein
VFADGEIPSWLMAGLKMSPTERFRLADWPRERKQFGRARRDASGELTRLVVCDGAVGESAQRFLAPTLRRSYAALEQHLHRGLPPFSTRPPELPADAVAVLDEYFRIPDGYLLLPRPEVAR